MKKFIVFLVLLNLTIGIYLGAKHLLGARQKPMSTPAEIEAAVKSDSASLAGAANNITSDEAQIVSRKVMSEPVSQHSPSDFAACCRVLRSNLNTPGVGGVYTRLRALRALANTRRITDEQKTPLIELLTLFLQSPNDTTADKAKFKMKDKRLAINILGALRDKHAVPVLLSALKIPSKEVQQSAKKALERLGYKG